jgi:hypothetical protein
LAGGGLHFAKAEDNALLVLVDDLEAEHLGRPIPGMRCTGFAGPADGTGVTASVRDALGSSTVYRTPVDALGTAKGGFSRYGAGNHGNMHYSGCSRNSCSRYSACEVLTADAVDSRVRL